MQSSQKKTLSGLRDLTPDFDQWPEFWRGTERDLAYGRKLLPYIESFLNDLIGQGLSRTTLQRNIEDAGLLGRTIIREVSQYREYRKDPLKKLREFVADGGTLPDGADSGDRMRAFERMCRRFEGFLKHS